MSVFMLGLPIGIALSSARLGMPEEILRDADLAPYRDVAVRTITMAIYVTIADAVLAFPLAYYMARVASPRVRTLLFVAVLVPLIPCCSGRPFCLV